MLMFSGVCVCVCEFVRLQSVQGLTVRPGVWSWLLLSEELATSRPGQVQLSTVITNHEQLFALGRGNRRRCGTEM